MVWRKVSGSGSGISDKVLFLGRLSVNPAKRPDGTQLNTGDYYYNVASNSIYCYTAANVWSPYTSGNAQFLGILANDPGKRSDGQLQDGDYYINSSTQRLRVFVSTLVQWYEPAGPASVYCGSYAGDPDHRPDGGFTLDGDYYYNTSINGILFKIGQRWVNTVYDGPKYLGAYPEDPGERPDGSTLVHGDTYFNTIYKGLIVYVFQKWESVTSESSRGIYCGSYDDAPTTRPDGTLLINGDYYWDKRYSNVSIYQDARWLRANSGVVFCGNLVADPVQRPDGSDLHYGDMYFNMTSNKFSIFNGRWVAIGAGGGEGGAGVEYLGETVIPPSVRRNGDALAYGDFYFNPNDRNLYYFSNEQWIKPFSEYAINLGYLANPPTKRHDGSPLRMGDMYQVQNASTLSYYSHDKQWVSVSHGSAAYLGASSIYPVKRPGGSELESGDFFFNTNVQQMLFYDKTSGWKETDYLSSRYLGEFSIHPSGRSNSERLVSGDYYYNYGSGQFYVYSKSSWIKMDGSPAYLGIQEKAPTERSVNSPLKIGDTYYNSTDLQYYLYVAPLTWTSLSGGGSSTVAAIYVGPHDEDPKERPDGAKLILGDVYLNTISSRYFIYVQSWVGLENAIPMDTGEHDSPPATRPDGSPLQIADTYQDSDSKKIFIYVQKDHWLSISGIRLIDETDQGTAQIGDIYFNSNAEEAYIYIPNNRSWVDIRNYIFLGYLDHFPATDANQYNESTCFYHTEEKLLYWFRLDRSTTPAHVWSQFPAINGRYIANASKDDPYDRNATPAVPMGLRDWYVDRFKPYDRDGELIPTTIPAMTADSAIPSASSLPQNSTAYRHSTNQFITAIGAVWRNGYLDQEIFENYTDKSSPAEGFRGDGTPLESKDIRMVNSSEPGKISLIEWSKDEKVFKKVSRDHQLSPVIENSTTRELVVTGNWKKQKNSRVLRYGLRSQSSNEFIFNGQVWQCASPQYIGTINSTNRKNIDLKKFAPGDYYYDEDEFTAYICTKKRVDFIRDGAPEASFGESLPSSAQELGQYFILVKQPNYLIGFQVYYTNYDNQSKLIWSKYNPQQAQFLGEYDALEDVPVSRDDDSIRYAGDYWFDKKTGSLKTISGNIVDTDFPPSLVYPANPENGSSFYRIGSSEGIEYYFNVDSDFDQSGSKWFPYQSQAPYFFDREYVNGLTRPNSDSLTLGDIRVASDGLTSAWLELYQEIDSTWKPVFEGIADRTPICLGDFAASDPFPDFNTGHNGEPLVEGDWFYRNNGEPHLSTTLKFKYYYINRSIRPEGPVNLGWTGNPPNFPSNRGDGTPLVAGDWFYHRNGIYTYIINDPLSAGFFYTSRTPICLGDFAASDPLPDFNTGHNGEPLVEGDWFYRNNGEPHPSHALKFRYSYVNNSIRPEGPTNLSWQDSDGFPTQRGDGMPLVAGDWFYRKNTIFIYIKYSENTGFFFPIESQSPLNPNGTS